MIDRGSAHCGHYFGYVSDIMPEDNWDQVFQETKEEEDKVKPKIELVEDQKRKEKQS